MRPLCLTLLALMATANAADLPTPAVELHPDGARLTWTIAAPAGDTVFDLAPGDERLPLTVTGATAWQLITIPTPDAVIPADAEALRTARNALQQRAAVLAAQQVVLAAAEQRLRTRLPRAAGDTTVDTSTWQAALDALLNQQAILAATELTLASERAALRRQAGELAEALAIERSGPLTADDLAGAWRDLAPRAHGPRRQLALTCAHASAVVISATRDDVWWKPSATLRLSGAPATAVLTRSADLVKPADLALGAVRVHALGSPLHPQLTGPQVPHIAVRAENVSAALRRQMTTGQRSVSWTSVGVSASARIAPARAAEGREDAEALESSKAADIAPVRVLAIEPPTPDTSAPASEASFAHGVDLDLGTVTLAAGSAGLSLTIDRAALTIVADEWALFPEDNPVAMRRVSVRIGAQPLLAGMLSVIADAPPRQARVSAIAAGSVLTLCAAIDETLCLSSTSPWDVDPAGNTSRFRRSGTDHWLLNTGAGPRTVVVYRTMPVSTSDELTVTRDAASTPGETVIAPGLLRWTVTLPPGTPQRVGLGWVMQASGSFSF